MTQTKRSRFARLDRIVTMIAALFTLVLLALAIWPLASSESPEIVRFLGRLHPILVHMPIGFLFALLVLELFDLFIKSAILHHATYIMAWLAAGAALLAVGAGGFLAYTGEYSDELLFWHRWLGVLTAVCTVWILAWKVCRPLHERHGWSFAYHPLLLITAALLAGAGHYGGSLTHGSDYLTAYMPGPLRSVLRVPERAAPAPIVIAEDPRDTVVFDNLVQPILETSCVSCHGPERQREDLRLDSYYWLIQGGDSGPDPKLIATSLRLPPEDERHMPPKDKPQLSSDEIALVTWWIEGGASPEARVRDLETTAQVDRILQTTLGIAPEEIETAPMQEWEEIEATVAEVSQELDVIIQRLARDTPALEIPFLPMDATFGDAELERLTPIRHNLATLNLNRSAITNDGLVQIAAMKNLTWLDLSNTGITDEGLAHLSELPRLEYLNLYGTRITDEGLRHLQRVASLRRVFLWRTGVTDEGVARFQDSLADVAQMENWRAEIKQLEERIRSAKVEVDVGLIEESIEVLASQPVNAECPVSGKPINLEKTATHEGVLIAFCCDQCLAKFKDDPAPILAKLDLAESPAQPVNTECPVSGKAIDPEKTAMHEGMVIAFCCGKCLAKFEGDPAPILEKLDLAQSPAQPVNTECPVSGKPIDPEKTATHEGVVIAFCCDECLAKFEGDPAPILAKLKIRSGAD